MFLDRITSPIWAAILFAALLALGVQSARLNSTAKSLTQLQNDNLKREAAQAAAVNTQTTKDANDVTQHSQSSQQNAVDYAKSTRPLDSALSADLQRIDGLRRDAEKRAARYRQEAEAGATACRSLADRYEALDRSTVEGLAVVAQLRTALERRDAEVKLLRRQIEIDREFMEANSQ